MFDDYEELEPEPEESICEHCEVAGSLCVGCPHNPEYEPTEEI